MVVILTLSAVQLGTGQAAPPSPREQLNQFVAELRKNPSDDALRERIIKLALTLDPKPAIPDDAAVAAAKGKTIFSHASETGSKDDLTAAADAFAKASLLAPWVPDYYFNQGSALEKTGQFDDAIRALNFYLLAVPNATDANDVRGRVEGLKYAVEKAGKRDPQKQAEEQRLVAQHQEEEERTSRTARFLDSLEGARYIRHDHAGPNARTYIDIDWILTIRQRTITLISTIVAERGYDELRGQTVKRGEAPLNGHEFQYPNSAYPNYGDGEIHGAISDDGATVTLRGYYPGGQWTEVYQRQ